MGVTMTKAQPVAAARKKKHKPGFLPVIHEYVPKPHQLRSKTLDLHYRRNDKLTSLAQVRAIITRIPVFGVCHVDHLVFKPYWSATWTSYNMEIWMLLVYFRVRKFNDGGDHTAQIYDQTSGNISGAC